jgi:hypothetical protein
MSNKRMPAWNRAMDEARANRAARPDIREERLKIISKLTPGSLGFSNWRGKSGTRYVVGLFPVAGLRADPEGPAVVFAIRRPAEGRAELIGVRAFEGGDFEALRARAIAAGATEIGLVRTIDNELDRARAAADFR